MKSKYLEEIDCRSTLDWLKNSIAAHSGNGSAAFFTKSIYYGWNWSPAYPETTGYIIPTLLDYFENIGDPDLEKYAKSCTDWLCSIQMSSGAFTGVYVANNQPSIFNTGQILFGLERAYSHFNDEKYLEAMRRAVDWLHEGIKNEQLWEEHHYVEGYMPTYYTRVVWPMLLCNRILKNANLERDIRFVLKHFESKIREDLTVKDWGFFSEKPAHTHTVAYTIRGFLESAILIEDPVLLEKSKQMYLRVWKEVQNKGRTAGSYDFGWKGDFSYRCLTGNAQLSIIGSRLFEITGSENFNHSAKSFFAEIADAPSKIPLEGFRGGIRGSSPTWGKYMRFKFPNWAAKFYLDAALELKKRE